MNKTLLFLLILSQESTLVCNQVAILVHGTWGANAAWHQPNDPFYETLKAGFFKQNIKLINFSWSGKFLYTERLLAGQKLAALINSYPANTSFILITHSHGSNVAISASHLLTKKNQIAIFYALGTPVDMISHAPNMNVIKKFYHLFSFADMYQTVMCTHARIFPKIDNIYNLNIEINDKKPLHEELHCIEIAKWLPQLSKLLANLNCDSHINIKFYLDQAPKIIVDQNIKSKLDFDDKLQERLCHHIVGDYLDRRRI